MDFRISADDRVGGQPKKPSKPRATKAQKAARVEPPIGPSAGIFGSSAPPAGGSGNGRTGGGGKPPRRGKAPAARGKKPRRSRTGGFLMGVLWWGFVASLWVGIGIIGIIVYYGAQLPSSNTWAVPDRPPNIRILAADGSLISNRGQTGGEAVTYRELPYYVPAAIIASEDRRFMSHFGVDPIGMASVILEMVKARGVTRGASTITQQVAKNLFLTPDQTLGRKVQEAILAIWLEQNYTKEQILELYMNRVYFGAGATGIEAAAQTYFGVSARNLSLGQAAMLAGILPAPSAYNPKTSPEKAIQRQRLSLNAMAEEGYITKQEAEAAQIDPSQSVRTRVAGSESYVADWVESLMTAYIGDIQSDVVVHTTIDYKMQKDAEFIVKEQVAAEGEKRHFTQGALVAMDVDGKVRAMVGGVDYQASQYNRAVTARRQPGSTFKPFVYLAAMEKGYTPDTLAEDAQFTYEGWSPRDASGKYAGTVTLRQALAYSINTVAARLAIDVTPQVVVDVATRMGISTPLEAVPSIALGTQEVNLLELTSAYAPFANGGMGVIPNVITSIESTDGTSLYQASDAGPGRVIAPNVLAQMDDMLKTAVEVGTGKRANIGGWDVGGKTGTSQEAKDALFVGFTSAMVAGVWLGNDDATKTTLSGGNVPATIWSQFMTKALAGKQPAPLPSGSYEGQIATQQVIDPATGQVVIDPTTGQAMVQYVDAATGLPVQTITDPTTGQVVQIDPATGQPVAGGAQPIQSGALLAPTSEVPPGGIPADGWIIDANGQRIDPTTGLPMAQIVTDQAIDPVTGFALQPQTNGVGQAPIDPDTGLPMTLVVDPATGQQVWVPSAPAQQQMQPATINQPTPVEKPRTLMDLIFGG
ncbi:MAG: PBP1A family penicillin-binding protein [Devosia sp.]|jgi:penicillin-binding protein 1A